METRSPAIVSLQDVVVRYVRGMPWARRFTDAVNQVSLEIAPGETLGLVGESGSGKSTLGKICLGIQRPTRGAALFEGEPFFGIGRRRPGSLAAVLQHPEWSMNPRLSIGRSIAEPLRVLGEARENCRPKVAEMLARVGLPATVIDRYPHELSGGQRQRASIARALMTRPRLVVFDEAVSALDVSVQAQILNLIRELQGDTGFAALFISHDIAAVRYVAHRIAVLRDGVLQELAPARDFYVPMQNTYVRQLQIASGLVDEPDTAQAR